MIAVDTNILVHAHRRASPFHAAAAAVIGHLAAGSDRWAIPWPCVHEFYGVTTNPRLWAPPSAPAQALAQIDAWLECPHLLLLAETDAHWPTLRGLLEQGRVAGPMVHDARIAALCLQHGVRELLSADRDFGRFAGLKVRNPLIG